MKITLQPTLLRYTPASSINWSHLRSAVHGDLVVPCPRTARCGQRVLFTVSSLMLWNSCVTHHWHWLSSVLFRRVYGTLPWCLWDSFSSHCQWHIVVVKLPMYCTHQSVQCKQQWKNCCMSRNLLTCNPTHSLTTDCHERRPPGCSWNKCLNSLTVILRSLISGNVPLSL